MSNPVEEGYVSFETAKLLKEKGFNEDCVSAYQYGELTLVSSLELRYEEGYGDLVTTFSNSECKWNPDMISAPTLQTAMRWLRKRYHYYIQIMLDGWSCGGHSGYYVLIQKTHSNFELNLSDKVDKEFYNEPEEAAEAAIKYCLENLI